MKKDSSSRRNFLKKSALTTGLATMGVHGLSSDAFAREKSGSKLPREVWVAGISQERLQTSSPQLMVEEVIRIMEEVVVYQPDVICLPEVLPTSNTEQRLKLPEKLKVSKEALKKISDFAKQHRTNIICSLYTSEGGKAYNSGVVLNREGKSLGEYRKIHLTSGEIEAGLTPGPLTPPVFQTDFGKIGIQICFDILWDDGWAKLKEQGAEIVFWPSAFAGGQAINLKSVLHRYIVASSTRKNTSKICDVNGEVVAFTGKWDPHFYCAPVNLEKAFLHTWPFNRHFAEIREKYGRKIKITTYHEEEWSIIESLSSDVKVADILKEYDIKSYDQLTRESEIAQNKARGDSK